MIHDIFRRILEVHMRTVLDGVQDGPFILVVVGTNDLELVCD